MRLSDVIIRRLESPTRGNRITWDSDVAGFGARITAAGSRAFVFNYRVRATGQSRRITIGQFPNWSTSTARVEAKRLKRLVDTGEDPLGEIVEQREAPTVADLIDRFEREHLPKRRPSTVRGYKIIVTKHIRPFFGKHTRVADVGFADIDRLHRKITATGSTYIANRAIAVCSKMFALAIKWNWCEKNPCIGIEKNPEAKRKRYLVGDELQRLTAALADTSDKQFVSAITLLLLTGARKGEVLAMRWADLDLQRGVWTKLASATKQKNDHAVPLSEAAREVLSKITRSNSEFVFPSSAEVGHLVDISDSWEALCARAGIEGLRVHDLRHSFASLLVSSGASLPLIGALLGHSNPATTARYSHLFDDPQRAAVEKIGAWIKGDS
jgi:integrase